MRFAEELVTNNGDQSMSLMALKADDEEQMKQSLAEPDQGPRGRNYFCFG